jgi:hypothetical protein
LGGKTARRDLRGGRSVTGGSSLNGREKMKRPNNIYFSYSAIGVILCSAVLAIISLKQRNQIEHRMDEIQATVLELSGKAPSMIAKSPEIFQQELNEVRSELDTLKMMAKLDESIKIRPQ